jgi:hypothetical protein
MNCIGAVVFWEWSACTWAVVMGFVTVAAAARVLAGDGASIGLLRRAMQAEILFAAVKLAGRREPEAVTFGVAAVVVLGLLSRRDV